MADENIYHIKFPGNITLEVTLQKPHPVNLKIKFPDQISGVRFSYSPEGVGEAMPFGNFDHEHSASDPENRVRPKTTPGASAAGAASIDLALEYNDPGGSRM